MGEYVTPLECSCGCKTEWSDQDRFAVDVIRYALGKATDKLLRLAEVSPKAYADGMARHYLHTVERIPETLRDFYWDLANDLNVPEGTAFYLLYGVEQDDTEAVREVLR